MTRGELVVVIFFVLTIAIVGGSHPEVLPWYSDPSKRSSPPASTIWEELVA